MPGTNVVKPPIAINPKDLMEKIGVDIKLNKNDLFDIIEDTIVQQYRDEASNVVEAMRAKAQEYAKGLMLAEEKALKNKDLKAIMKALRNLEVVPEGKDLNVFFSFERHYSDTGRWVRSLYWYVRDRKGMSKAQVLKDLNTKYGRITLPLDDDDAWETRPKHLELGLIGQDSSSSGLFSGKVTDTMAAGLGIDNLDSIQKEWEVLKGDLVLIEKRMGGMGRTVKKARVTLLRNILGGTPEGLQLAELMASTATGSSIVKQLRDETKSKRKNR